MSGNDVTPEKAKIIWGVDIITSLILSQFTYLFSMLYTPPNVLNKLKKLILNLLWNNKPPRIKYDTMIANIKDGGLKLPDITSFHNAQKAFWIKSLQTSGGKWKKLFIPLTPRMLGISDEFLNLKIIDILDEKKLIPAKILKRKFKCKATILDICLISAIPVT